MLRSRYRWVFQRLRAVARPAIAFECWSSLILLAFFAPVSGWMLNRLVVGTGQFAVSDTDLLAFFLSLRGVLFVVFNLGFIVGFWCAEKAGLLVIVARAGRGEKVAASVVLWEQATRFPALLRLGVLQATSYIVAAVPFGLGIWLTKTLLLREWDFYYYLNVRPSSWWVAVAIAGSLVAAYVVVAAVLYVRWMVSVPALVFEGVGPVEALKLSWQRTRGRVRDFGGPLVLCWLVVVVASAATTWLIRIVASQVLVQAGLTIHVVVPVVVATLLVMIIADLLWLIAGKTVHTMLTAAVHFEETGGGEPGVRTPASRVMTPRRLKTAGWLAAGGLPIMGIASGAAFVEGINLERSVEITGHRGTKVRAPENTLAAVRDAIAEGADYAEIDVQTTRDGVVILLHDGDLMRVASVDRHLQGIDDDDLRNIDVGSWFDPAFSDERIPTLEQVIDLARGRIRLNIELKFNRSDPTLTRKVIEIVRRNDFTSECVLSSLNVDAVTEARATAPELPVGLIIFTAVGDPTRMEADFLSISAARATAGLVRNAHRRDRQIHVWTVSDFENVLSMIAMGVDNIITDQPSDVRRWATEWDEFSDSERTALMLRNLVVDIDRPEPGEL